MRFKKVFLFVLMAAALATLLIYYCDRRVKDTANDKLFSSTATIPYCKTGLLLGTAKLLAMVIIIPIMYTGLRQQVIY